MTASEIKELASLLNIGIPVIVGIIVFVVCIINVDKIVLLLSYIQKAFSSVSRTARKGTISNSIRGRVLKSAKAFRSMGQHVMVSDLKIDWVKEESAETFIQNNQVIIRMSQNPNPHKNYVTAVNAYVGQALLPRAKRYIDPKIMDMSKLSVSRLLVLNGDADALDYFDDNILLPAVESDSDASDIFERLKVIDKNGMFLNILLNEYAKAARKIYPDQPDPLLVAESKELLTYLHRIAMGGVSDLDEFQFNREYFKIHVFLTANSRTFAQSGLRPYLKHMSTSLSQGTETLYIFGLGRKMDVAKQIADALKETDFRITQVIPHFYRHRSIQDGHSVRGVCYEVCVYEEDAVDES